MHWVTSRTIVLTTFFNSFTKGKISWWFNPSWQAEVISIYSTIAVTYSQGHRWAVLLEGTRTFLLKGFNKAASRRVKDFPYKISLTIGFHGTTSSLVTCPTMGLWHLLLQSKKKSLETSCQWHTLCLSKW